MPVQNRFYYIHEDVIDEDMCPLYVVLPKPYPLLRLTHIAQVFGVPWLEQLILFYSRYDSFGVSMSQTLFMSTVVTFDVFSVSVCPAVQIYAVIPFNLFDCVRVYLCFTVFLL